MRRKKQARSNKQTRQSTTAHPRQSLFLRKMSCLTCTCTCTCTYMYIQPSHVRVQHAAFTCIHVHIHAAFTCTCTTCSIHMYVYNMQHSHVYMYIYMQHSHARVQHTAFTDSTQQRAIIYNTGLSSFTSGGTPLIRQEQILVVGHELGHNWGSHHDPQKCKNGYLMNEFAQDGAEPTHSVSQLNHL